MKRSIPPRLRPTAIFVIGAAIVLAIGGATHGWATLVDIVPIPVILIGAFYVLSRRDSDTGALIATNSTNGSHRTGSRSRPSSDASSAQRSRSPTSLPPRPTQLCGRGPFCLD
jgi:hypothetical protein